MSSAAMPVSSAARCGRPVADALAQAVEAFGVAGDVIGVVEAFADDDVHHGQRQRGIAAGIDEEVVVGGRAGAVAVRIDGVELRAVAARFHDERPEMDVGAEDVGAPGQDQPGVAELLGLGAVAHAERLRSGRRRRRPSRWCGPGAKRRGGGRSGGPCRSRSAVPWCRRSCRAGSLRGRIPRRRLARRAAMVSSASSQVMRSKRPSPLAPTRRCG